MQSNVIYEILNLGYAKASRHDLFQNNSLILLMNIRKANLRKLQEMELAKKIIFESVGNIFRCGPRAINWIGRCIG
jgi:hypothetical protein